MIEYAKINYPELCNYKFLFFIIRKSFRKTKISLIYNESKCLKLGNIYKLEVLVYV